MFYCNLWTAKDTIHFRIVFIAQFIYFPAPGTGLQYERAWAVVTTRVQCGLGTKRTILNYFAGDAGFLKNVFCTIGFVVNIKFSLSTDFRKKQWFEPVSDLSILCSIIVTAGLLQLFSTSYIIQGET